MPADDLRTSVASLMGRAKDDLAELVAFRSVADPKQFPPEECAKAAQWVAKAFAEAGLGKVTMSRTADGSMAVHGHAPAPDGAPTVLLYCHYDVMPPLAADQWRSPVWELTDVMAAGTDAERRTARATSRCISPRCVRSSSATVIFAAG